MKRNHIQSEDPFVRRRAIHRRSFLRGVAAIPLLGSGLVRVGSAQQVDAAGGSGFDVGAEVSAVTESLEAGVRERLERRSEDDLQPYHTFHFSNAFVASGAMVESELVQLYETRVDFADVYRDRTHPGHLLALAQAERRYALAEANIYERWDEEAQRFRTVWYEDEPYIDPVYWGTLIVTKSRPPPTGHSLAVGAVYRGANGYILKSFEKSAHDGVEETFTGPQSESSDGGGGDDSSDGRTDAEDRETAQRAVEEAAKGVGNEKTATVGLRSVGFSLEPDPFEVEDDGEGTTTVRTHPDFRWLPTDRKSVNETGSKVDFSDVKQLYDLSHERPAEEDPESPAGEEPEPSTPTAEAVSKLYDDLYRKSPYEQSDEQDSLELAPATEPDDLTLDGAAFVFGETTFDTVEGWEREDYVRAYLEDETAVQVVAPPNAQVGWEPLELFRAVIFPSDSIPGAFDGLGLTPTVLDRAESLASRRTDVAQLVVGTAGTLERSVSIAAGTPESPIAERLAATPVGETIPIEGRYQSIQHDQQLSRASAATTDSQMAYLLDAFDQNRGDVPGALAWVLGDERARVRILADDEPEDVWWVEVRDGAVARYAHGDDVRPTVQVFADRGALHGVLAAEDPSAAAIEAFDTGAIRVTGVGLFGRLKFGFAKVVYALLSGFGMV